MVKTKVIAYYLPQFHEIQENNLWWGQGFTEWTNVKKAEPLFEHHNQPRIPLNHNYYNLMDKKTVEWQTKLASEYGIDGFAYYHYWFEGKLLLEKPAENLLEWKDIPQNFFFFWANHSWYKAHNGQKDLLMKQEYGGQADWENHFHYINRFFQDKRYIKVDNKPVVGIHLPENIPCLNEMILLWNKLARQNGFDGIYIIESKKIPSQNLLCSQSSAMVMRQPDIAKYINNLNTTGKLYSIPFCRWLYRKLHKIFFKQTPHLRKLDYNVLSAIERDYTPENYPKTFYCVSTGWDNTPRHQLRGEVMLNESPDIYYKTLQHLYNKSVERQNEFLFINAWNEWAEGMYLEPDETNQYAYLEATKKACSIG